MTSDHKPTYPELLRDPRWQELRLRVMDRAGFACEECGDRTTTLNVHHTFYERGKSPWEYPPDSLSCLCEPCHEKTHLLMQMIRRRFGRVGMVGLLRVAGYMMGLDLLKQPHDDKPVRVPSKLFLEGVLDAFGCKSRVRAIEAFESGSLTTNWLWHPPAQPTPGA